MHPFRTASLALLLLPTLAFADQGVVVKFSWDHCAGDGYVGDRSFACNTNTGTDYLYGSVIITDGNDRTQVAAFQAHCDISLTSSLLPPWWQANSGYCRQGSLSLGLDGTPTCGAWYAGSCIQPLYVFGLTEESSGAPNQRVIEIGGALAAGCEVTIPAGEEKFLFRIGINHAKSAGAGSCGGCTFPACLGFGDFILQHPGGVNETFVGSVASTTTWQGGYVASYDPVPAHWGAPWGGFQHYDGHLSCATGPVPAQNHTWGSIKSMYR